jgi:hypothetical protein
MKPLIFYPPKAHEKAIAEFLKAQNAQSEEKQDALSQHMSTGIKKGREDIKGSDTLTSEEFKKHL